MIKWKWITHLRTAANIQHLWGINNCIYWSNLTIAQANQVKYVFEEDHNIYIHFLKHLFCWYLKKTILKKKIGLVVTGIFETKAYMRLHSRGILPVKALARVQWQTEQDDDVTKQLLLIYDKVSRSIMDAAFLRCDITLSWKRKISLCAPFVQQLQRATVELWKYAYRHKTCFYKHSLAT